MQRPPSSSGTRAEVERETGEGRMTSSMQGHDQPGPLRDGERSSGGLQLPPLSSLMQSTHDPSRRRGDQQPKHLQPSSLEQDRSRSPYVYGTDAPLDRGNDSHSGSRRTIHAGIERGPLMRERYAPASNRSIDAQDPSGRPPILEHDAGLPGYRASPTNHTPSSALATSRMPQTPSSSGFLTTSGTRERSYVVSPSVEMSRKTSGTSVAEARRIVDTSQGFTPSAGPRPLPSIREGDVPTLASHLQYEINLLGETDGRTADHMAMDVRYLYDQYDRLLPTPRSDVLPPQSHAQASYSRHRANHVHPYLPSPRKPSPGVGHGTARSWQPPRSSAASSSHEYHALLPVSAPAVGGIGQEAAYHATSEPRRRELDLGRYQDERLDGGDVGLDRRHQRSPYPSPMHEATGFDFRSVPASPQRHHRPSYLAPVTGPSTAYSSNRPASVMPRRVRKRRDEAEQSCLSCGATETPEWRKGPTGPRTLCNACGLLFAKQSRKREGNFGGGGGTGGRGGGAGVDDMTAAEREASLLELQTAVQARTVSMGSAAGHVNHPRGMVAPSSSISDGAAQHSTGHYEPYTHDGWYRGPSTGARSAYP